MERRYNRELKKKRRKKLILRILAGALVFLALFFLVIYPIFNIKIASFEVKDSKIPDSFNNYKIVQVSDLYLKSGDKLDKLADKIGQSQPDLLVLNGNIFSEEDKNYYQELVDMKNSISESLLVYIVKGESELEFSQEYSTKLYDNLKKEGIYLLDDKKVDLNKGGKSISILGIVGDKDQYKLGEYKVKYEAKEKLDPKEFNLAISHNPSLAESLSNAGADLVLSGARNAGWVRLPFIGGIDYDQETRYKEDDYKIGKSTILLVSRGSGSKKGKLRLFNPRQINEIILKR